MDIIALKRLLIEKTKQLTKKLLEGSPWERVQQDKQEVTFLSIELDKRLNRNDVPGNPAEHQN